MFRAASPNAIWALAPAILAASACASTPTRTSPEPTAAPVVQPSEIPLPPSGAEPVLDQAWLELRDGGPIDPMAADGSPEGRALAGYQALRAGDVAGAQRAFQSALEADPALGQAAYGMGLVALAQERRDVAREWFTAALERDPTLVRAAVQLRILSLGRLSERLRVAEDAERAGDLAAAAGAYEEAVASAPDVATLYLRLASVEERMGDTDAALAVLERGRRRAGDDPGLLRRLGLLYRATGSYAEAYEVLRSLQGISGDDAELAALTEETRRLYEESSLPPQYRELADRDSITREELAAILAISLEGIDSPDGARAAIVSDVDGRWSAPFVQRMVSWGVLDVYQNNAFWPDLEVTRSMLVEAAFRTVQVLGLEDAAPRPRIADPPPEHLLYRPVQTVVGLGVLEAGPGGAFDLLEPVTGREAVAAAERLASAVRRLGG